MDTEIPRAEGFPILRVSGQRGRNKGVYRVEVSDVIRTEDQGPGVPWRRIGPESS